ncbi:MAG: CoA-binding protein [Bilophila wadsworthia]
MREFLTQARTIAVVGAKDKEGQPVDRVGKYLIQAGYQVIPVHPIRKDVWSLQTYPSLAEVPFPVDIVNVFRLILPDHARETVALCPNCFDAAAS